MSKKANLAKAMRNKKDEFYTSLSDIEQEMKHYRKYFKGKTVYLNCDDPRASKFFHYFSYGFEYLGLRRLIASCYKNSQKDFFSKHNEDRAIWLEYTGEKNGGKVPTCEEIGVNEFEGDGDFRSKDSIDLLKQADIVVTNPPFSLFREYMEQLQEYGKKFLVIGNFNAVSYKEISSLIRLNKVWLGINPGALGVMYFDMPGGGG